jgi:hypothetical protein
VDWFWLVRQMSSYPPAIRQKDHSISIICLRVISRYKCEYWMWFGCIPIARPHGSMRSQESEIDFGKTKPFSSRSNGKKHVDWRNRASCDQINISNRRSLPPNASFWISSTRKVSIGQPVMYGGIRYALFDSRDLPFQI